MCREKKMRGSKSGEKGVAVSYNLRTVHVEALFEFLNAGLQLGEEFTNGVQPTRIKGGLDYGT
jgi:hypothetical protein